MKLQSITYTEFEDKAYVWTLEEMDFTTINLVVGKNATGKSRLLRILDGLARLIEGSRQASTLVTGSYKAFFVAGEQDASMDEPELEYSFAIIENKVVEEKLTVGSVEKLVRGAGGRAQIRFEKNKVDIPVQIPETHLAASSRRDSDQHPFFEPLHKWAGSVKYFEFSKFEQQQFAAIDRSISFEHFQSLPLNLHLAVKFGKDRFGPSFIRTVVNDMQRIGFDISDVGLMPPSGLSMPLAMPTDTQTLYVVEDGIGKKLPQSEISNGMVRALGTLIFLHFTRLLKNRGVVLIDDIGEGLDFERATKLISLVIKEAEQGHMQTVMTTNDRFIMNGVPLKYWSVIQRQRGKVSVFNERNSSKAFAEFEEYGFNNFDFFSKELYSPKTKS